MTDRSNVLERPWAVSPQEVLRDLEVTAEQGLSELQVKRRRMQFGPNHLRQTARQSALRILLDQFKSVIVVLLAAAAVLSFALSHWFEGVAIVVVVILNGLIGFFTEWSAVRSMETLRRMGSVTAAVRRGGQLRTVPARDLVPGDIVIVEGGDVVTADLRVVMASRLQVDESALTGESVPVEKDVSAVALDIPLAERRGMLFKGTAVTRGSGEGVVVATGMRTELGRISALVSAAEEEQTPLEIRLEQLGRRLVWLTLGIAAAAALVGIIGGKPPFLMVQTAIALAVAAIPEGLPIVATAALARGMWRMSRRNALINRLSAVETLGSTTVICTDKTGTLTENRMEARLLALEGGDVEVLAEREPTGNRFARRGKPIRLADEPALSRALRVGVLCNNASLQDSGAPGEKGVGDPLELALLQVGVKGGLRQQELRRAAAEVREVAFDPQTRMMATIHQEDGKFRVAVKGAPETVLQGCTRTVATNEEQPLGKPDRERWLRRSRELAAQGLRVLALADKVIPSSDAPPYEELTMLALVGLVDPPRGDVRSAIAQCRAAGIRVIMVTGDHAATARYVASAVGLPVDDEGAVLEGKDLTSPEAWNDRDRERLRRATVVARVDPEQKLNLVALYQSGGEVVAMTGDGVNDAPALKKADIGVAMGERGTQVAREAADMILRDDAFATIVASVEQGRIIFTNIRKFVVYLLSCNVSEILVVALASLAGAPLPLLPLQILFLNVVTDVFPALALAAGEGDSAAMRRPPRDPREPVLTRRHWFAVGGYGALITGSVLTAFAVALVWLKMPVEQAVTVSFLTLGFAQLWHVFNMRDEDSHWWRNDITRNPFIWGAVVLCIGLLLAAVYLPPLHMVLALVDPSMKGWLLVIGMSIVPWIAGLIKIRRGGR